MVCKEGEKELRTPRRGNFYLDQKRGQKIVGPAQPGRHTFCGIVSLQPSCRAGTSFGTNQRKQSSPAFRWTVPRKGVAAAFSSPPGTLGKMAQGVCFTPWSIFCRLTHGGGIPSLRPTAESTDTAALLIPEFRCRPRRRKVRYAPVPCTGTGA